MLEGLFHLDGNLLLWIQNIFIHPLLTPVMQFITRLGDSGMIWVLASIIMLFFPKTRRIGVLSLIALLLSLLIVNFTLKNLFARNRPYDLLEGLQVLIHKPSDYSFPSGHTSSSFCAAITMYLSLPKKYGIVILILASLIAFSRLYLGVHYPTDIIGGVCIGIIVGNMVTKVYQRMKNGIQVKIS